MKFWYVRKLVSGSYHVIDWNLVSVSYHVIKLPYFETSFTLLIHKIQTLSNFWLKQLELRNFTEICHVTKVSQQRPYNEGHGVITSLKLATLTDVLFVECKKWLVPLFFSKNVLLRKRVLKMKSVYTKLAPEKNQLLL